MSSMLSRWPVVISVPLEPTDRDRESRLTEAAVERIFDRARAAYFQLCRTVGETSAELATVSVIRGVAVDGMSVSVSVGVVEVYPDSFTMEARVRPETGDGIAAQAKCSMSLSSGVSDAIRDEFIALAHAARHMH